MIADDVRSALPELRAEAESLMTTPCTVTRKTGETVLDEAAGVEVDVEAPVWAGLADFTMPRGAGANLKDSAGQPVAVTSPILKLPLDAPLLALGDAVMLGGRRYVVRANVTASHPVTYRYQLDS